MPRHARLHNAIAAVAFFAAAGRLLGQGLTPNGGEFPIIGNLPGDQVLPSLSLSPAAGVLAWQDSKIDRSGWGLGGAILDNGFTDLKSFRVNKAATGDQKAPHVQLLANGNIVFVWESKVAGSFDIYARFARQPSIPGGAPVFYTSDLRVNTYTRDSQMNPAVAATSDGGAIVTWASYGEDGSLWGVYARKLTAAGRGATTKEFPVNQYTPGNQRDPAVASLANGDYVIAWVSEGERSPTNIDIYARIFQPNGAPVLPAGASDGEFEIPINSGTDISGSPEVAANNDGGFTVVWNQQDYSEPTNGWDIWGRAFTAIGAPEVQDFRINTYLYGDQYRPKIAAGPSGSMVVWTSMGQDGSREGVFGRYLLGGSQVSGPEMQVNTTTVSQQIHPAVAWNGVDRFLVVWSSFTGVANGFDLFGQAYTLTGSPQ